MRRTNTAIVLMSVMAMILMTAIPVATAVPAARATGTMDIAFIGDYKVPSGVDVEVKVNVFNSTAGNLQGAFVALSTNSSGTFDDINGTTDATGIFTTVFHAPVNMEITSVIVPIQVFANKSGYANLTKELDVEVVPATRGAPMMLNISITHWVYKTTYATGSMYSSDSQAIQNIDLLGNVQVNLGFGNIMVANYSIAETGVQTFVSGGFTHHITYTTNGYSYYQATLQGIVYSVTNMTRREHVYNGNTGSWSNTTQITARTYFPAKMTYNASMTVFGQGQMFINTYEEFGSVLDLDTHVLGAGSALKTEVDNYIFIKHQDLGTFMGSFPTDVFMGTSRSIYEYNSPDLGIVLLTEGYDQDGELVSTKELIEYNALKVPDPLPPLAATITSETQSLVAGTSTPVHVTITNGTAPVAGATIVVTASPGGTVTPTQGVSGVDGTLVLTFAADLGASTTDVVVSIVANKTGYMSAAASSTIIVLQDITPPFVSHRPFETAEAGVPLKIDALAGDDAGVAEVVLHYRVDVPGTYLEIPMTLKDGVYTATIPAEAMVPPLVEYWLSVSDINGNGVNLPYVAPDDGQFDIHVLPTYHIVGPVSVALANGGTASITAGVRGDLSFNLTSVTNPDAGPIDTRFMGQFADLRAVGSGTLEWANISFKFTSAILGKLNEQELQIYWWDTQGHTWMSTDHDGVIADQDLVWANVSHLTIFAPRALTVPVIPVPSDTTAPTASVIYPSNLATMNAGSFKLVGQASDDRGLFSVQVQVDNGAWVDVLVPSGAKSAGWVYDLSLKDGKHTIVVRAKDQAGNLGSTTTLSLTLKKETDKENVGVTMNNIIGAIMALIIVCLVVLLVFFIGKSTEKDKGPAKPGKEIIEKDEEE
jgi:hypothetical protein